MSSQSNSTSFLASPEALPYIHVISPASKEHWQSQFIASATSLDDTGFPLSGSFGVGFSCPCDLAEPEDETIQERMVAAISSTQPDWTPRKVADSVRRLLDIYAALQPDTVVAFKEGKTIVAFVRILGPYFYEPTNLVPHRWNYKIIRKTTSSEANPPNAGGLIPTFRANYIPTPVDLLVSVVPEPEPKPTVLEEPISTLLPVIPHPPPLSVKEEPKPTVLEETISTLLPVIPPSPPSVKEEPTPTWGRYIGIATVAGIAIVVAISVIKKRRPQ